LGFAALAATLLLGCGAPSASPVTVPIVYELYSWKEPDRREWTFSLLDNTSREKNRSEMFGPKTRLRGLEELKNSISGLLCGSTTTIVWIDSLSRRQKATGTETLSYPPQSVIDELRKYAAERGIALQAFDR
jgi:hypothetical protein